MKVLAVAALLLQLTHGFVPSTTKSTRYVIEHKSTSTDEAFSAFADSLDEDEMFDDDMNEPNGSNDPSWQESLEMLLDPSTPAAKRQILLSDLLNANDDIRNDVQNALKERKVRKIS